MFKALMAARCKQWLRKRNLKVGFDIHRMQKHSALVLEEGVSLGRLEPLFKRLQIGAMTYVRSESELQNVSRIGRFCSIGNGVIIGQEKSGHPMDWVSSHPFQYTATRHFYSESGSPAQIGHDVWIGRDAMIMEGVKVSTGAVIAARSLVTRDIPPYAIVAGTPARIIRYRHPSEIVAGLLASTWWELPTDMLAELSVDTPEKFLYELAARSKRNKADYNQFEINRRGCRQLSCDSQDAWGDLT